MTATPEEGGGRRRKRYALTAAGREALEGLARRAHRRAGELREPALLKLFFGADPDAIGAGPARGPSAEARRVRGDSQLAAGRRSPKAAALRSTMGIRAETQQIAYWEALADARDPGAG